MTFSDFAPLVEVFTALNLAYSIDFAPLNKVLRKTVFFDGISSLHRQYVLKSEELDTRLKSWATPQLDEEIAISALQLLTRITFTDRNRLVKEWEEFFTPTFLSAGFLCITFLLIQGLVKSINHDLFIIIFSLVLIFHIAIAYLKTFEFSAAGSRSKYVLSDILLHYISIPIISTVVLVVSAIFNFDCISSFILDTNKSFKIAKIFYFSPLFAYFGLFLRITIHIIYEKRRLKKMVKKFVDLIERKEQKIRSEKKQKGLEIKKRKKRKNN